MRLEPGRSRARMELGLQRLGELLEMFSGLSAIRYLWASRQQTVVSERSAVCSIADPAKGPGIDSPAAGRRTFESTSRLSSRSKTRSLGRQREILGEFEAVLPSESASPPSTPAKVLSINRHCDKSRKNRSIPSSRNRNTTFLKSTARSTAALPTTMK
jgi:hypothetical protein